MNGDGLSCFDFIDDFYHFLLLILLLDQLLQRDLRVDVSRGPFGTGKPREACPADASAPPDPLAQHHEG